MKDKVEGLELLRRVTPAEICSAWNLEGPTDSKDNEDTIPVQTIKRFLFDLKSPINGNMNLKKSLLLFVDLPMRECCTDQRLCQKERIDDAYATSMGWFIKAVAGESQSLLARFTSVHCKQFVADLGISISDASMLRFEILQAVAKKAYEWLLARCFIRGHVTWPTSEVQVHIALLGSSGSGKSSLLYRLQHNASPAAHHQLATSIDFVPFSEILLNGNLKVKVFVWDATNALMDSILHRADGVLMVYDASQSVSRRSDALAKARRIDADHRRKSGISLPIVLFGNKCEMTKKETESVICDEPSHYLGSAATGVNVKEAIHQLVCETALLKYNRRAVTTVSSMSSAVRLAGNSSIFSWYKLLLPL